MMAFGYFLPLLIKQKMIYSIEHSDFLYKLFFLKDFKNQCIIDDFNNEITKEFNEVPPVDYNEYFSNDPTNYDYNVLDTIKFPHIINYGLDGYFNLNAEEKDYRYEHKIFEYLYEKP